MEFFDIQHFFCGSMLHIYLKCLREHIFFLSLCRNHALPNLDFFFKSKTIFLFDTSPSFSTPFQRVLPVFLTYVFSCALFTYNKLWKLNKMNIYLHLGCLCICKFSHCWTKIDCFLPFLMVDFVYLHLHYIYFRMFTFILHLFMDT